MPRHFEGRGRGLAVIDARRFACNVASRPTRSSSPAMLVTSSSNAMTTRIHASRAVVGGGYRAAGIACKRVADADRDTGLGEDLTEAGVASPSIAIARCSITRWAMLATISGCWTGRF
jgi:hypothetical protein